MLQSDMYSGYPATKSSKCVNTMMNTLIIND